MERDYRRNSILSCPQKWKQELTPIPVSVDLQTREAEHELKINEDPKLNKISGNMKQSQTPLQHIETVTVQSIFTFKFCIMKVTLVKNHLKLAIMSTRSTVIVCCNGLWPVVDMQEEEAACLASIKQFLSNNKSIPSLPHFIARSKRTVVRKPSLQEKHNVSNMQQVN